MIQSLIKIIYDGASLVVQWLRIRLEEPSYTVGGNVN